ncbi:MAG TPA: hypothetical protein VKU00_13565 [Chthonomonadaceae bacterium]|nr:hypothetical protein [Chthonomonadaceae bacterium]
MIGSVQELRAALHQFGSFLDLLEALRLQAEEIQSVALFAHVTIGPISLLAERDADIQSCLRSAPNFLTANPKLHADLRFFACLAEALLASYQWSEERNQFPLFIHSAAGLSLNLRAVADEMRSLSPQKEAA